MPCRHDCCGSTLSCHIAPLIVGLRLWQLWSSLGESVLEVDVYFHGITATPSALFIDGGAAWTQTLIRRAHTCEGPHMTAGWAPCMQICSCTLTLIVLCCSCLTSSACTAAQPNSRDSSEPLQSLTAMHGFELSVMGT